jgi:hypothetical protein
MAESTPDRSVAHALPDQGVPKAGQGTLAGP